MGAARLRALLCVMLRQPTLRPDGEQISPERMAEDVLERGPDSLVRVCSQVGKNGRRGFLSSPANRVFDVAEGLPAKKWIVGLGPLTHPQVLRSHYISDEALNALISGDHVKFLEERTRTLMGLERGFMKEKGVTPPKSDESAPSAIDVEDQVPLSETIE